MELLQNFTTRLLDIIPTGIAIIEVVFVIFIVKLILDRRYHGLPGQQFQRQLILLILSFIGLLVIILALPISETMTGQLLSLIGILLSAAIALSATTFVGNIMAGFMLKILKNFKPGDFIRVKEQFGRVSEMGLIHVEIQTEDSDLTTMPNLYVVTNPVKVIRKSGTLLTAEVSLGYDIDHNKIEKALIEAANVIGLEEAFVHVMSLGDFSVTYRIAGFLKDIKTLLTTQSNLKKAMLDCLHKAHIEIVSPAFMNQRPLTKDQIFIPAQKPKPETAVNGKVSEIIVFDKADEAESLEKLIERKDQVSAKIKEAKKELDDCENDLEKDKISERIENLNARLERIRNFIIEQQKED